MRILLLTAILFSSAAGHSAPPIEVYAPPSFEGYAARIRATAAAKVEHIVSATGSLDQRPIRVVLAQTSSPLARAVPPWASGYALPEEGMVILFPERNPSYPDDSLEETFLHELAHVLIERSAGGGRVPRWFHEGLATVIERSWTLTDWSRFAIESFVGGKTDYRALDRKFSGPAGEAREAYSVSARFVLDILQLYGPEAPKRILRDVAGGKTFDRAFFDETLLTPESAWLKFWARQSGVAAAVPMITSSFLLWIVITLIALVAIRSKRSRSDRKLEEWEEEERRADLAELEKLDEKEPVN